MANKKNWIEVHYSDITVKVSKVDYDKIVSLGYCLSVSRIKKTYGTYFAVMIKKKIKGKIEEMQMLSRFILGLKKDDPMQADHINQDPTDNRRDNLRLATRGQNQMNIHPIKKRGGTTSRYKGVRFKAGKWEVAYSALGKQHYLGRFDDEKTAALAYNEHAKKHYGEFAVLNEVAQES